MRKSSLSLATLAALAAAGMMATPAAISDVERITTGNRSRVQLRIQPRFTGRRYPEQSSRQALRLHRRAQGGLGLVFTGTGYEPAAKFEDYLPR